ncbi:hypothetical protein LG299_02320 [Microbacterium lacus]|uniref:hypothetical protein n=1 Tax=Microbacterium lacus TaxID=415217 RepID=UPI00384AF699
MSIFTRNADATPTTTDLPAGYDDDESHYFVPADVRAAYDDAPAPGLLAVSERVDEIVGLRAREAVASRFTVTRKKNGWFGEEEYAEVQNMPAGEEYTALVSASAAEVKRAEYADLVNLATHQLRLEHASATQHRAAARAADRAASLERRTCPTCAESDPAKHGGVSVRDLHDIESGALRQNLLRSCFHCFTEAQRQIAAARRADVIDAAQGLTREDVVFLRLKDLGIL